MIKVLQQGDADGLCGIYSIMNFLQLTDWEEAESSNALLILLDACRHFGWLTPESITEGFQDYQLKAILDLQIENWRLPFNTFFLEEAKKATHSTSVADLLFRVAAAKGAAIVSSERRNHWLLVTAQDGKPIVCDSSNRSNPISELREGSKAYSPDWGIIVLKHDRPVIEIEI